MNSFNCEKSIAVNYDDYSTQDRKILTWNGENYADFVSSFTVGDLLDMLDKIEYTPDSCELHEDYGWCISSNAAGIIYSYTQKNLKELLDDHIIGEEFELATAYLKTLAALTP